jgi:hypothetical protein
MFHPIYWICTYLRDIFVPQRLSLPAESCHPMLYRNISCCRIYFLCAECEKFGSLHPGLHPWYLQAVRPFVQQVQTSPPPYAADTGNQPSSPAGTGNTLSFQYEQVSADNTHYCLAGTDCAQQKNVGPTSPFNPTA